MSAATKPCIGGLLSQWDQQALQQLAAECARLAAENEALRQDLSYAEECADSWRDQALAQQLELCKLTERRPGITIGGLLVTVAQGAGR